MNVIFAPYSAPVRSAVSLAVVLCINERQDNYMLSYARMSCLLACSLLAPRRFCSALKNICFTHVRSNIYESKRIEYVNAIWSVMMINTYHYCVWFVVRVIAILKHAQACRTQMNMNIHPAYKGNMIWKKESDGIHKAATAQQKKEKCLIIHRKICLFKSCNT